MAPMTRLDGGFDRALDDLDLRIVTRSPVLDYLHRLLDEYRELDEGQVATYIPELGRADPNWFGICVVTADGHVYEVGDTDLDFTIQSISKPFVFGLALEDHGRDRCWSTWAWNRRATPSTRSWSTTATARSTPW